jgi:cytidyltransferase-like protein
VLSLDSFPHAKAHLEKFPFRAPERVHECVAWYEGSFNPMHEGHAYTVQKLLYMGFRTVVVGTVPRNPHKVGLPILPLDERVQAIKEQLLDMRMPIAESSKERGVFVTATPESFHDERLRAWYRDTWYVIMGPDNFQTYFEENRAWALFAAKDEEMKDFSRFRRLYETFLKDRILVNDEKYAYHATDIRNGSVPMMPAIERRLGGLVRRLGNDAVGGE